MNVGTKVAPNQGKMWSHDDKDQLKALFLHGFKLEDLCERLGRTPWGILSQLEQMHLVYCDKRDGHYYPYPAEPWMMWQAVNEEVKKYKPGQ